MSKEGVFNLPGLRKSVKKTIQASTTKRKAGPPVGSSPQLRTTKRVRAVDGEDEEDQPVPKKMATADANVLSAIIGIQGSLNAINDKLVNVPSKDDLTQVEVSIGERISANSR